MIRLLPGQVLEVGARVAVTANWADDNGTQGTIAGLIDGEAGIRWDDGHRSWVLASRVRPPADRLQLRTVPALAMKGGTHA